MGLILTTFLIGVLNLLVGYAAAVRFGYGPATLLAPWYAWQSRPFSAGTPMADEQFDAMLDELVGTRAEEMLDVDDQVDLNPMDDPYDDEAALLLNPDAPEIWDINEKYVETSILRLNVAMMKSGARATEIDTRLRAMRGKPDAESICECRAQLMEDCQAYLAEQSEAAEKFSARIGELGELAELGEEIEFANMNQASQIETTVSNLKHMDFEAEPEAAIARLLEEIANLRQARHRLRDDQEAAFLAIARYENRMDRIEEKLFHDSLTGVRNRIGLEAMLWQWWQQRRHESRPTSAALFDIDGFGVRNEEYGCRAGDRVLKELTQVIQSRTGPTDSVARFAGQRVFVMIVDKGPRSAIKEAETIRQTVEQIVFACGDSRFRLTLSGAVTEFSPEDESYMDVFERLERSLREAKRSGRNRLFACKRSELQAEPEPIQAPGFGIEMLEVEIG